LNQKNRSYENSRLSIQLSLNGLSFCITDTVNQNLIEAKRLRFPVAINESELKNAISNFLELHQVLNHSYESVVVVHTNPLFNIVPIPLFNKNQLADYVKFNTQVLPSDEVAYDLIEHQEMAVVYIPFTSVNNYIFEHFGSFDFKHHSGLHLEELLPIQHDQKETACYLHLDQGILSMTVIKEKKLLFFNQFTVHTTEDLLYFILFSLEQLHVDIHEVQALFYGETTAIDPYFKKAAQYIAHCSIYRPSFIQKIPEHILEHHFDMINLNA
jgi:hypothetical protein